VEKLVFNFDPENAPYVYFQVYLRAATKNTAATVLGLFLTCF